jgi:multidrug efflux pump
MVLVTGMTVGTIFTLFVVPVFYSLIAAEHQPLEPHTTPDEVGPEELTLAEAQA